MVFTVTPVTRKKRVFRDSPFLCSTGRRPANLSKVRYAPLFSFPPSVSLRFNPPHRACVRPPQKSSDLFPHAEQTACRRRFPRANHTRPVHKVYSSAPNGASRHTHGLDLEHSHNDKVKRERERGAPAGSEPRRNVQV